MDKTSIIKRVIKKLATPATVKPGKYTLYHGTSEDNGYSIITKGLTKSRSLDVATGKYLIWFADSVDRAYQHALGRKRENIIVLEFELPVPEVGLHKSILKGIFTVHEKVEPKYIKYVHEFENEDEEELKKVASATKE